jgi:hypothetical protein
MGLSGYQKAPDCMNGASGCEAAIFSGQSPRKNVGSYVAFGGDQGKSAKDTVTSLDPALREADRVLQKMALKEAVAPAGASQTNSRRSRRDCVAGLKHLKLFTEAHWVECAVLNIVPVGDGTAVVRADVKRPDGDRSFLTNEEQRIIGARENEKQKLDAEYASAVDWYNRCRGSVRGSKAEHWPRHCDGSPVDDPAIYRSQQVGDFEAKWNEILQPVWDAIAKRGSEFTRIPTELVVSEDLYSDLDAAKVLAGKKARLTILLDDAELLEPIDAAGRPAAVGVLRGKLIDIEARFKREQAQAESPKHPDKGD